MKTPRPFQFFLSISCSGEKCKGIWWFSAGSREENDPKKALLTVFLKRGIFMKTKLFAIILSALTLCVLGGFSSGETAAAQNIRFRMFRA